MKKIILLISILFFVACKSKSIKEENFSEKELKNKNKFKEFIIPIKINKLWESEKILKIPESIIYDKNNNCYYVSNINGESDDFDNNGFISKLDINGKIIKLKWMRGLNAPKGMGIFKNKLYVTDIDKVIEIDIEKEMQTKEYLLNGKFLNDISINREGMIFISDMTDNKIYIIKDEEVILWLDSSELQSPNGLLIESDRLLVGQGTGELISINLLDKTIKKLDSGFGATEGITKANGDQYFISNWYGAVYYYDKKGNSKKIFDTKIEKYETADIYFDKYQNILLVPTFSGNSIIAYKIKNK